MRFLGVTESCDLAALYLRLRDAGDEVRVSISDPLARGTLAGMIEQVADWRGELDWIRAAGRDGVILFESVSEGFGALQGDLRRDGFQVIGGSVYGDRLENDRAFAQAALAGLGFPSGHVWEFGDTIAARDFIAANPSRYVLKVSGAGHDASDTYVGRFPDGRDVQAMLLHRAAHGEGDRMFILMQFLDGIEMGVGAYFNGEEFLLPACLDWEHKRFFAGDLGELTGEMGTVATFEQTGRFFRQTLGRIAPLLRGHGHVGYVNLNTIVNEDGIWPLEFTCRFGYPGFAVLDPLQQTPWRDLFRRMLGQGPPSLNVVPGFSTGIVLTTPPFPYDRKQVEAAIGVPVSITETLDDADRDHLHFGEIGQAGEQLVTSGLYGWTMVVTGTGSTVAASAQAAYRRIAHVHVPNGRYRLDIGERLAARDLARLEEMRLLGD